MGIEREAEAALIPFAFFSSFEWFKAAPSLEEF
jgi:hypothetical protein